MNTAPWIMTAGLAVVFEALGALGLVLPALSDTASSLVPLAAVGLALLMIGAAITHARRREYPDITANLVLAAPAVFRRRRALRRAQLLT
jgi:hypothetical protein